MKQLILSYQLYMEPSFLISLNNVLKCRQWSNSTISPRLLTNIIFGGHQHRLPYHPYLNYNSLKKQVKIALNFPDPILSRSFCSFEELYDELNKRLRDSKGKRLKGIGDLTLYDIALRIGYIMPSGPILPLDYLYLQSGALLGYKALQKNNPSLCLPFINKPGPYDMALFKGVFSPLSSMLIEDMLCVYHNDIAHISSMVFPLQKKVAFGKNVPKIK